MKKRRSEILFRASGAGKLIAGLNEWNEKHEAQLIEFEQRKSGTYVSNAGRKGAYTETMKESHQKLIEQKKEGDKLGKDAKSFIEQMWLSDEYGYRDEIVTKEVLKGQLCEQDSMSLVSKMFPVGEFRKKNKLHFENEYFKGTPDIILSSLNIIEDVKTSWDISTFFKTRTYSPLYYGQGQVYMDLTGAREFNLYYCLVTTPVVLVEQIERSLFYRLGDGEMFHKISEQLHNNHYYDDIPEEKRIKIFTFQYDPEYIEKLKKCAELGRDYYESLELDLIEKTEKIEQE